MSGVSSMMGRILRKLGIHERVRYSHLYYQLLPRIHPDYHQQLVEDEQFYRKLFPGGAQQVFDIGGNMGDKTWVFLKVAKRVVVCEPDPVSFARLKMRFGGDSNVELEECAVGDKAGRAILFQSRPGSEYNTLNPEWHEPNREGEQNKVGVRVTTLDKLIAQHGTPDYLKIDVEGFEWPAIQGLTRPVGVLSFEANLPQFKPETALIVNHVSTLMPQARFRVRHDDFIHAGTKSPTEITEWLAGAEAGSYEIFAFADGRAE